MIGITFHNGHSNNARFTKMELLLFCALIFGIVIGFCTALLIHILFYNKPMPDCGQQPKEFLFMYIVKADNPDVGYSLNVGEVKDSEGNVIADAQVTVEIASDNEAVVSLVPTDDRSGSLHFGTPGQANITANVKDAAGDLLGTGAASFTITTGDPDSVSGVGLSFEGLKEV